MTSEPARDVCPKCGGFGAYGVAGFPGPTVVLCDCKSPARDGIDVVQDHWKRILLAEKSEGLEATFNRVLDSHDAELALVKAECEAAKKERDRLDASETQLIGERDRFEEWADKLAYAIAHVEDIGEHSNLNKPWEEAYNLLTSDSEVREMKAQLETWKSLTQKLILDPTLPEHLQANAHKIMAAVLKTAKERDAERARADAAEAKLAEINRVRAKFTPEQIAILDRLAAGGST